MKGFRIALTGLAAAAGLLIPGGIALAAVPGLAPAPRQLTLTAPSAPYLTQPASAATAVAPTISPSVRTGHVAPGGSYTCPSGDLCALPWDPTTSSWKIFYLYACRTYALSNWNATGYYFDNQSSNAVSYFYNQSHGVLMRFMPDYTQHSYNYTPVYYIKNC